jgi:predicted GNAT family acetyltransferase
MSFRDQPDQNRMSMDFDGGEVWVDYARRGETLSLLHVEADHALRGSGAAGKFMQAVVDHARAAGLKLHPVCSYAVTWMRRHRDADDVAA